MRDTRWLCGFRLENKVGGLVDFSDGGISQGTVQTIVPGGVANYRCSVGLPPEIIKSLTVTLRISFRTLWFERQRQVTFTWLAAAAPPRWMEGPIVEP
jgi:hypothetical protein